MATFDSPIANSTGSSSLDSVKNWDHIDCPCGIKARIYTSWSLNNLGRRFYTCSKRKAGGGCDFFEWYDLDFTGRAKTVITDLNHRRIFLEEKMRLVEEDLEKKT
ncbi:GRF-type domain-containing protein [Heracleum sosnowskyi]|uniref:GRF-type domain-containing protein n=1 Tax=Heracleum sosnowskyi TaxID=360622 RepID=A0AAD8IID3_9APIA|nr:GRF-type domain-containing protein [Heracleum sosnowskyi]